MAGTTALTQTLDRLKVVVGAVTGIDTTARVFQGYKRFTASENYESLIEALSDGQGYFDFWLVRSELGYRGDPATFNIAAKLYTKVTKDSSNDLNSGIDLCVAVRNAILSPTNWTGFCRPIFCAFEFKGVDAVGTNSVATWSFGGDDGGSIQFLGGCGEIK